MMQDSWPASRAPGGFAGRGVRSEDDSCAGPPLREASASSITSSSPLSLGDVRSGGMGTPQRAARSTERRFLSPSAGL